VLFTKHRQIDVLCGMGVLVPSAVDFWRKGRIDFLKREIQGSLNKISSAMAIFRWWAIEKGLKPSETGYVRHARSGIIPLQFSLSGAAEIEKRYRTHHVSPTLSERKQQKLQEKVLSTAKTELSEDGNVLVVHRFDVDESGKPTELWRTSVRCLDCALLRSTKPRGRESPKRYGRTCRGETIANPAFEGVSDPPTLETPRTVVGRSELLVGRGRRKQSDADGQKPSSVN
jgi:hypothetical protein